jgi:D-alanine-D-alanine ligase
VGAETRILLLSNRDHQDPVEEPPLGEGGRRDGASAAPAPVTPADSGAPVAASVLDTLAGMPGVRVAHRPVYRPSEILAAVRDYRPSVVFNLCEALGGDSRLEVHAAWLLERLGLPFTGSPYHALRHCLYKVEANHILARAGVRVPATVRVDSPDHLPRVQFPVIVKPEREDGSNGICFDSVVHDLPRLRDRVALVIETFKQPAVVQRYIHGREIGISLLGWPVPRVMPPGEILFGGLPSGHPHILTFSSKWHPDSIDWNGTSSVPAVLRPPELRRVAAIGRRAFEVLGLRDYGRVDVRLDDRGQPFVIDVNPNCDLSHDGGLGLACARGGLSTPAFIWEILRGALRRRTDISVLFASRGRSPRNVRASARPGFASPSLTGEGAALVIGAS